MLLIFLNLYCYLKLLLGSFRLVIMCHNNGWRITQANSVAQVRCFYSMVLAIMYTFVCVRMCMFFNVFSKKKMCFLAAADFGELGGALLRTMTSICFSIYGLSVIFAEVILETIIGAATKQLASHISLARCTRTYMRSVASWRSWCAIRPKRSSGTRAWPLRKLCAQRPHV